MKSYHRLNFYPESLCSTSHQSIGFLARFTFDSFPFRIETVVCSQKLVNEAYSCGYSSGFAPDSLF